MSNRKQHTIPRFYLKPFLSPGLVYRRGEPAPRKTKNPASVAIHQNYYGRPSAGRISLDNLNSELEGSGAPVFKKLVEAPSTINSGDWKLLSLLLANIAVRTPAHIEEMRATLGRAITQANVMNTEANAKLKEALEKGSDLSGFKSFSQDDGPRVTIEELNKEAAMMAAEGGHRVVAGATFSTLVDVAKYIRTMSFKILDAPDGCFFVTSDRPLILRSWETGSRVRAGWAKADALATIPLTPRRHLFMFYADDGVVEIRHREATPDEVININLTQILFARNEVYSSLEFSEASDWMKGVGRWKKLAG